MTIIISLIENIVMYIYSFGLFLRCVQGVGMWYKVAKFGNRA